MVSTKVGHREQRSNKNLRLIGADTYDGICIWHEIADERAYERSTKDGVRAKDGVRGKNSRRN